MGRPRKPKHYISETWQQDYLFFQSWKYVDYKKFLEKNFGVLLTGQAPSGHTAFIQTIDASIICVWTENKKSIDIIAHECCHAANYTLARSGVEPCFDNDEAQCYLLSELLRAYLKI